jgi:hypothetical protein
VPGRALFLVFVPNSSQALARDYPGPANVDRRVRRHGDPHGAPAARPAGAQLATGLHDRRMPRSRLVFERLFGPLTPPAGVAGAATCRACGSPYLRRVRRRWWEALLTRFSRRRAFQCEECEWRGRFVPEQIFEPDRQVGAEPTPVTQFTPGRRAPVEENLERVTRTNIDAPADARRAVRSNRR